MTSLLLFYVPYCYNNLSPMSIRELIEKINIFKTQAPDSDEGEIISYEEDGKISSRAGWYRSLFQKLFLSLTIILVSSLSFGIGRLSVSNDREPVRIEYDPSLTASDSMNDSSAKKQQATKLNQTANALNAVGSDAVAVSKNGTRYHYLHCGGAKQIKKENKIVFATKDAAEAAGFTLAANCKPR